MKEKTKIKYSIIIFSIMYSIFSFSVYYINFHTKYTFLLNLFGWYIDIFVVFYILALMICAWSIWGLIVLWRKASKTIYKIFIALLWIPLIIFFLYASLVVMIKSDDYYYEFQSDNKKHEIVIQESTFLLSGSLNIYDRKNAFVVEKLNKDDIFLDDAIRPIYFGDYHIKWDENILKFSFYLRDQVYWKVITVDYGNGKRIEETIVNENELENNK
ncbi:hypothetical protein [Helcococcus massiliensis]|uniref:hypothetical protein n=1 Tax=Helcococcus massiliensis TaxID=2040290 RepID=UPI000CDEA1B5|nr:hypothetical protein [Helcococcus massiliensis]